MTDRNLVTMEYAIKDGKFTGSGADNAMDDALLPLA
jgi:hypothetical protein